MSSLIRFEPFRDLATLRDRMERLFGEGAHTWGADEGLTAGSWTPPVDVFQTADHIVLRADLPGMNQGDVDISVEGNTLTVKGERKRDQAVQEKDYYRMERRYGPFARTFNLPPTIDAQKIEASFARGVLTIRLPKREESKPRQIRVKIAGENGR